MATGQQDGRGSLPLAWQRVQFTYGQTAERKLVTALPSCMRKSHHTGPQLPPPSTAFSGWHSLAEPRAEGTLRAFRLRKEKAQS